MDFPIYSALSDNLCPFSTKPIVVLCPDQDFAGCTWCLKFGDAAQTYVDTLRKAGAQVLVLKGYDHVAESLISLMDGWLIPGGMDIDPKKYNAPAKHPTTVSLEKHDQRFALEKEIYKNITFSLPILGICYGSQLLNVLNGGSLIQHIPNFEEHCEGKHRVVKFTNNSKLSKKETTIKVRCYHHQAIERRGKNIEPIVFDSDGIIHGIELNEPGRWVVGVQWHPERSQDDWNQEIICEFVRQARLYRIRKMAALILILFVLFAMQRKAQEKRAQ